MSRLDLRSDVNLPVTISLRLNGGNALQEKAEFANICLGGGLIKSHKSYPINKVVQLHCDLPGSGEVKVAGEITRTDERGRFAARFYNLPTETKLKIWHYIREYLPRLDSCPYCRNDQVSNAARCRSCGMILDFSSSDYLEKHEKWAFLKRLAVASEIFSLDDISRILKFIDQDILGIGRSFKEESTTLDSGAWPGSHYDAIFEKLASLASLREAKNIIEKQKLIEALNRHNNNISKVAKVLEVSRPSVYSMIKRHGIEN